MMPCAIRHAGSSGTSWGSYIAARYSWSVESPTYVLFESFHTGDARSTRWSQPCVIWRSTTLTQRDQQYEELYGLKGIRGWTSWSRSEFVSLQPESVSPAWILCRRSADIHHFRHPTENNANIAALQLASMRTHVRRSLHRMARHINVRHLIWDIRVRLSETRGVFRGPPIENF